MSALATILCFTTLFNTSSAGNVSSEANTFLRDAAQEVVVDSVDSVDFQEPDSELLLSDAVSKQVMDYTLFTYGLMSDTMYESLQAYLSEEDSLSSTENGMLTYDCLSGFVKETNMNFMTLLKTSTEFTIEGSETFDDDDGEEEEWDSYTTVDSEPEENQECDYSEEIPLIEHNDSNMEMAVNKKGFFDGRFIGIYANKDACVAVYNKFTKFVQNKIALSAAGFSSAEVLAALELAFPEAVASLTSLFSSMIAEFTAYLSSLGGPIVTVIAIIVSVFAVLLTTILVSMYYCGSKQCGFAIGWIVHSLFSWEWINEVVYD